MEPTWCTIYSQPISLILFITSPCFGPLHVHHQEEQLYLCDAWRLLFRIADCLVNSQLRWFHLQDNIEMHGQQNIKLKLLTFFTFITLRKSKIG